MNRFKYAFRFLVPVLALAAFLAGCGDGSRNGGLIANLYAVDSRNGKVFELDTTANLAATIPLVTAESTSGEIVFEGSRGFIAVGNDGSNVPGLYTFDAANPSAGTSLVGSNISAQYICIVSPSVGYVTSSDYYAPSTDGLYSFNPSDPGAGIALVVGVPGPQDVIVGSDSKVYVAENAAGKVARIDPTALAESRLEAEIPCAMKGATGLLAGNYGGDDGVFVANSGNWGASDGSIEFIALGASSANTVLASPTLNVSRLAAFSPTKLVATGFGATYIVDLSGPAASPVMSGATSFGSFDVNIVDGVAYVPDGGTKIYGFGPDGVVTSVIAVGASGDWITNVGIPGN